MLYRPLAGFVFFLLVSACTFTQKVKTGMQAYEVKQYSVAAKLFETEYEEASIASEKANLAFLAGESYRHLNDNGSAGNWYSKAYKDGFGEQALLAYANSLKIQERYQEALRAYEDLLQTNPGNASYRSNVTLIRQAMDWNSKPDVSYKVKPALFNSTGSDYSPQPIAEGIVLFTSDRGSRQSTETYLWTGRFYSDLFISNLQSSQVVEYDPVINSPDNEGSAVISPDGSTLAFTRCFVDDAYDAWCKLMFSSKRGNSWTEPEAFPFVKSSINYGHPAFAANGSTIFFSSDAPEGQGGHDIYFSQLIDGVWSEPVNLGSLVNSMGDELFPTVYKDTLYYSSDHIAGLGGLDIFKTYLDISGQWVSPINLRAPVNSGGDDFGLVVDTFSKSVPGVLLKGYFSSSREGTSRYDDIYSFERIKIHPEDVAAGTDTAEVVIIPGIDYQVYLALKIVEPVYAILDDPNSDKTGTKALPNGPVILEVFGTEQRLVSDNKGQLLVKLDRDRSYTLTARYRDHLTKTDTILTTDLSKNPENPITTINRTIELDPIFKNKEIILENIFYDYEQWNIRADAEPSLDHLAEIMKSNPGIRVQLSSHTDCRGTDEYNLDLSQKRAQAAIDYLISVGIPSKRLQAQGFGESNPAVNCECESCSEENHQKNRRTTFKIID